MNVLMIAPGYPAEMPLFARGLAWAGAQVYGLSDVPQQELPEAARRHLTAYLRVPSMLDEAGVVRAAQQWLRGRTIDRVVCLWEPGVLLAARLREGLGVAGMGVEQSDLFRDKDLMKQAVSAAGVRCPLHAPANTAAGVREAAEKVGYPLIIKPIDGAGSMDTYRVADEAELEAAIARMGHVPAVNVEEFIEADEYTFDTICIGGEIQYFNVGFYRPRPLVARQVQWISPQTLTLRDVDAPHLQGGIAMGRAVLQALDFKDGFTHMEWYRKADGETVFGEIAARPPGAHTVDLMNYGSDIDLYAGFGEATVKGTFTQKVERKYNSVNIFKRAQGEGRIRRIEGLDRIREQLGEHLVHVDLLPVGAQRRDWIQTLVSDGYVVLRHPDFGQAQRLADTVGRDLQLYAG
jgi:hypothetical protein